jgi:HEAT repeat protein/beta-lactamase regulating signal transducer with metallopeptidase domain
MTSASEAISEFVLNCVVNATWQIAVIAAIATLGALLLRNGPARYRHVLWLTALSLCVVVPFLTALPKNSADQSLPPAPQYDLSIPLGRANPEPHIPVSYLTKRRTQVVSTTPQTGLWLTLGYTLFLAWRGIRLACFWRRKERLKRSTELADLPPEAQAVARRCRAMLGIEKVEVVQAKGARMPCTIGARKPLIVLPEAFCAASEEHLLSVMGHEMAHVARRDYLTNFIAEVAMLPVSFHPLTLLIKKEIDRARELACDDLVSKRLLPPKQYARSLVWAADVSSQTRPQALLLSMFDARSLEERVMRLTRNQKMLSRSMAKAVTSITMVALFAAAVALSLFSFELKTEARAAFAPTAPSLNAFAASADTATTQHPRRPVQPRGAEPQDPSGPEPVQPSGTEPVQPVVEPQQPGAETRLDASNAQQRAEAACATGRNGDTEKIPVLIAMLADDTKTELLPCWTNGRWSPALEMFKQPSPGEQAAIALASMGRPAFQPLTNQLTSENPTVRRNAAWAIGELTNMPPGERDGAVPRLISLLSDPDGWVRMASARALGELRHRSAVPALIANLVDQDAQVRELAIWALSELKDKSAVNALCNVLLSDLSTAVRRGAAEALGEIRDAEALPFLRQALKDPAVRVRAQWAISEIEGE